ncbi:NAD(P)-dependent dehydrogenase (short-subunit alcohol dehydrogenase family) [Mesocricetibacter intestinalis]|uniref:NAD(P)-dependent dehydrogenase (Short-subunit alcohol dehydrogenase family) n=1 Tax=Mesocricetibacter intestinalis TaxID=1521930 RepID=A0A4R6V728_9PAST|nr:SDR family oxidoreductase [Mesocricetibacter intestinalis]TDQ56816.1 NAD(P)-dependent dehydrogenase (short-subunit alcohol dehydrogenase family) [Mesocricetibacter intestinalis]
MRLQNKVAIITGASSGIGEKTAELFAAEGATLVIVARRRERLERLAEKIRRQGGEVKVIAADITSESECRRVIRESIEAFGNIDILVNNAGIADKHLPITKCSTAWWDEVILTDQTSVFYLTKAALEKMNKGSIVNVSSIGGVFGSAGISYSAAKSALLGMTKNVAIQYAGKGIRCNAVCPGPTPTELNTPDKLATFDDFAKQCAKHMNMSLPETRAEEQAQAILFFASDESSGVTGQVLVVDNGITL